MTALLHAWAEGDPSAPDALLAAVYEELRRQAAWHMRRQAGGHTLEPTDLVHEAYLRLARQPGARWEGRGHFFRVAGRVMRTVLVDHARAHDAGKRGGAGAVRVTLGAAGAGRADAAGEVDVLALDAALGRLAAIDAQKARVVELRYFAGFTIEQTAEALGVSAATVKREWTAARAWLRHELRAP
ncbi:ECF-type sigma factor [Roseisolibacter sp. H3M3-2]|uniref:ECF-type sigma factor n=1 Tax=Roseisolibacter sp. H3M3-2 TaxID=3031323 RepID=UPI0023DA1B8C|nr:ECF-type sigma factor [Roseisolibacter sp. H3M3-2]MDF1504592.1 ECF-type sigma factor [Roseisolibacter sp. H3M3-2]